MEDIQAMSSWEGAQLNEAKTLLADEATRLLHGDACLSAIHTTAMSLFGSGSSSSSSSDLESLPQIPIAPGADSMSVVDLLVKAQMATSKNAARRLIKNGGARINDQKVTSDTVILSQQDFDEKGRLKLSSGKKNHVVLVLT
jgi:tyrosyl-tRNA synthetase